MTEKDDEKHKREDELQEAIKKAGSKSFGVQKKQKQAKKNKEKTVAQRLDELEAKYVTRPAKVEPPLPLENPDNIKRSGIQKRYDPRDKNQFPEESAFDMKPFILEENRLSPGDQDQSTDTKNELSDRQTTSSLDWGPSDRAELKPDLFKDALKSMDNSMDLLGEDSIYEMEPIILPGFALNRPNGAEDSQEVEATGFELAADKDSDFDVDEGSRSDEDIDDEYGGLNRDIEPGVDPTSDMQLFPEHSQFELAPIVIDKAESKAEDLSFAEAPEPVKQSNQSITSEEEPVLSNFIEPGVDPIQAMDRMPEDSIYEMEPIVIPHQEKLGFEADRDGMPSHQSLGSQLEAKSTWSLEEEPGSQSQASSGTGTGSGSGSGLGQVQGARQPHSDYIEPGRDPIEALEPLPEDSIYELDPIVLSDLEQDSLTKPLSEKRSPPNLDRISQKQDNSQPQSDAPSEMKEWEDTSLEPSQTKGPARFTAPLISLTKDNRAPGSEIETAAIAREIATHQSMSAVTESRIQRALEVDPKVSGARQRPGQTLDDKYLITGIIGQGGISVVYKAKDLATGQIVAVKTLKENKPDVAMRFKREIETLTKLQHKNIVRAIEAITLSPGQTFLIMEHIKGISLQELIKQYGRAEHPEVIASILTQVCDGLAHAHKHKIIHRDLKGGNIVLTNVNDQIVVKILDFGIAKLEDDMQKLTLEGKAMGSPLFMSPEQCKGETLTVRSDLYSLGIVAYELITGELPVKGRSIVDVMAKHCDINYRPIPMTEIRPELPAVKLLDQLILRSLETEVSNRLRSIEQFKDGINFWIDSVREKEFDRVMPPELIDPIDPEEEASRLLKESMQEIFDVRNEALATGVSYTAVKEENEKNKTWAKRLPRYLLSKNGLSRLVVFTAITFTIAIVAFVLLSAMQH